MTAAIVEAKAQARRLLRETGRGQAAIQLPLGTQSRLSRPVLSYPSRSLRFARTLASSGSTKLRTVIHERKFMEVAFQDKLEE